MFSRKGIKVIYRPVYNPMLIKLIELYIKLLKTGLKKTGEGLTILKLENLVVIKKVVLNFNWRLAEGNLYSPAVVISGYNLQY